MQNIWVLHMLSMNAPKWTVKTVASTKQILDFPGGSVVKKLPANAGDIGLIPGLGQFHMPRGN